MGRIYLIAAFLAAAVVSGGTGILLADSSRGPEVGAPGQLRDLGVAGGAAPADAPASDAASPSAAPSASPVPAPTPSAAPASPSARPSVARSPVRPTPTRTGGGGGGGGTTPASKVERTENEVTTLVNQERAKAGCGPVRTEEKLRNASRAHSADMAAKNYFDHTSPDGSGPGDRAKRAGYTQWSGENIAMGYRTAAEVVRGWMESTGHRENILNCDAKATGTGLAYNSSGQAYWTQLFGWV